MTRPWLPEEMHAYDARRLGTGVPATGPRPVGPRVVRRIPTALEQATDAWRSADRWTRALVRQIARLGYDVQAMIDERVYLINVGRAGAVIVLTVDYEHKGGVKVHHATIGDRQYTPRQAVNVLRSRAPR